MHSENEATPIVDPKVESPEGKVHFREVSPAIEFMCWVVVALCPVLRLVNGPPVTDDQSVVQVSLVALSVAGALGLRCYNWRVKPLDSQRR